MHNKVYVSLVFHNHQPVGNFDFVFREAFEKSYLPLVAALERHPQVKAAMHFTGPLRDWLLEHERDYYLGRVGALVERGQLELLGGAYYEPILIMLSDEDKRGQLQMLSDAIEQDFGVRPRGMWLAERVWEPHLAKPIGEAGLQYTVIDDTHFHFAGFNDEELYGYYVTEEQNQPLSLIPASKRMRYSMPWLPVDEFLANLRGLYDDPATPEKLLLVAADDGEKFGLWPGTHKRCWVDGYIDELFTRLIECADWLETITPASYIDRFPGLGRAYLPTASYLEMTEWALPAARAAELPRARSRLESEIDEARASDPLLAEHLEAVNRYLRGGLWRNFLVKYPEVNHMQKRSVYTSHRIHAYLEGERREQALAHLWAAQCNCAYWHGVFGGIYLYHIRAKNYENLLKAEALIIGEKVQIEQFDFDLDSQKELVVNSRPFSFVVNLPRGGTIIEWDDLISRYNLLNVMSRYDEGYHTWLRDSAAAGTIITPDDPEWSHPMVHHTRAKERGLERHLIVDWHRRGLLVDHFLGASASLEEFSHAEYEEDGDFVNLPYEAEYAGSGSGEATVTLWRDGHVWQGDAFRPLRVSKHLTITSGERVFTVDYTLTNTAEVPLSLRFGVESTIGFDGGDSDYCYFVVNGEKDGHLGLTTSYEDVRSFQLGTFIRWFEVDVTLEHPAALWRFPLMPVTMSEAGFERVHQGAVLMPLYTLRIEPGATWQTRLTFTVRDNVDASLQAT
jgi:4-alpha-glucanotransferase